MGTRHIDMIGFFWSQPLAGGWDQVGTSDEVGTNQQPWEAAARMASLPTSRAGAESVKRRAYKEAVQKGVERGRRDDADRDIAQSGCRPRLRHFAAKCCSGDGGSGDQCRG